jgi:hypothetical protein
MQGFFFLIASPESAQFCAFLRVEIAEGVPETAIETRSLAQISAHSQPLKN